MVVENNEPLAETTSPIDEPQQQAHYNINLSLKSLLRMNHVDERLLDTVLEYITKNVLSSSYTNSLSTFIIQRNLSLELLSDILYVCLKFADMVHICNDMQKKFRMLSSDCILQVVLYATLYEVCIIQNIVFDEMLDLEHFQKIYFIVSYVPKIKTSCTC